MNCVPHFVEFLEKFLMMMMGSPNFGCLPRILSKKCPNSDFVAFTKMFVNPFGSSEQFEHESSRR